jgi:Spermidine synthase
MSWRSYLSPLRIFSHPPNSTHPSIIVTEHYGRRHLLVDGEPQSSNHYLSNWKRLLRARPLRQLPTQSRVLVLGLGAGQLAWVIQNRYPGWYMTFVEIDEVVIRVAKDFFDIIPTKQISIVHADAKHFVHDSRTHYDLIIVDLYSGDEVPPFVASDTFLRDLARLLTPRGHVLFNYASHDFDRAKFVAFEVKTEKLIL